MSAHAQWIWRFRGASCDSSMDEVFLRTNGTLFYTFGNDTDMIQLENFLTEFVLCSSSS